MIATCIYCGFKIEHGIRHGATRADAHQSLIEHDRQCPKNPIAQELAAEHERADNLSAELDGVIRDYETERYHRMALERSEQALEGNVDRLQGDIRKAMIGLDFAQRHSQGHAGTSMQAVAVEQKRLTEALEQTATTHLDQLKARFQAEILEVAKSKIIEDSHGDPVAKLEYMAYRMRRQAEGGEH